MPTLAVFYQSQKVGVTGVSQCFETIKNLLSPSLYDSSRHFLLKYNVEKGHLFQISTFLFDNQITRRMIRTFLRGFPDSLISNIAVAKISRDCIDETQKVDYVFIVYDSKGPISLEHINSVYLECMLELSDLHDNGRDEHAKRRVFILLENCKDLMEQTRLCDELRNMDVPENRILKDTEEIKETLECLHFLNYTHE